MKKKLEADLISIAHKVLKMKNKSDVNQLYIETQKLYEKLSILRFVEEHFGETKPTIGQAEIVEKMNHFFEDNNLSDFKIDKPKDEIVTEEVVVTDSIEEEIIEDEITEVAEADFEAEDFEEQEEITLEKFEELEESDNFGFQPAFELDVEYDQEPKKKQEAVQISFEDLLGENYNETLFVKLDPIENIPTAIDLDSDSGIISKVVSSETEPKTVSLNETLTKGIKIDLNDRIAFVKHLFGNSNEDYNRVLNQLITYDSFEEAQDFIEDMVKPDYNNWEGKEDYSQRFMEIIEKKFA